MVGGGDINDDGEDSSHDDGDGDYFFLYVVAIFHPNPKIQLIHIFLLKKTQLFMSFPYE